MCACARPLAFSTLVLVLSLPKVPSSASRLRPGLQTSPEMAVIPHVPQPLAGPTWHTPLGPGTNHLAPPGWEPPPFETESNWGDLLKPPPLSKQWSPSGNNDVCNHKATTIPLFHGEALTTRDFSTLSERCKAGMIAVMKKMKSTANEFLAENRDAQIIVKSKNLILLATAMAMTQNHEGKPLAFLWKATCAKTIQPTLDKFFSALRVDEDSGVRKSGTDLWKCIMSFVTKPEMDDAYGD